MSANVNHPLTNNSSHATHIKHMGAKLRLGPKAGIAALEVDKSVLGLELSLGAGTRVEKLTITGQAKGLKIELQDDVRIEHFHVHSELEGGGSWGVNRDNLMSMGSCSFMKLGFVKFTGSGNRIIVGDNVHLLEEVSFFPRGYRNGVEIGSNCSIRSAEFVVGDIGVNLILGSDVMGSTGLVFSTTDSHPIFILDDDGKEVRLNQPKDIHIGDHCWLCSDAKVLKGGRLGAGSILGTGAILSGDLSGKKNCIVAGRNKIVRTGVFWARELHFSDEELKRLEATKYHGVATGQTHFASGCRKLTEAWSIRASDPNDSLRLAKSARDHFIATVTSVPEHSWGWNALCSVNRLIATHALAADSLESVESEENAQNLALRALEAVKKSADYDGGDANVRSEMRAVLDLVEQVFSPREKVDGKDIECERQGNGSSQTPQPAA